MTTDENQVAPAADQGTPSFTEEEMLQKFFVDDDEAADVADEQEIDELIERQEQESEPAEPPFRETATPAEMLEASRAVMNSQASFRPIFYHALDAAREGATGAALVDELRALPEMAHVSYPTTYFFTELYDSGALDRELPADYVPRVAEHIDADAFFAEGVEDVAADGESATANGEAPAASADASSTAAPAQEAASVAQVEKAAAASAGSASAVAPVAEGANTPAPADANAPAPADANAPAPADAATPDADVLPPEVTDYIYTTTDTGRALLDEFSPTKRLANLFDCEADLVPGFLCVLKFCSDAPRTRQDIEEQLKKSGCHIGLDLDSTFYMDRLEERGGLVWDKGWITTKEGKACLKEE